MKSIGRTLGVLARRVLDHIRNGITRFPVRFPSHEHVRSSEQRDRKTNRFKQPDTRADHSLVVLHHGIGSGTMMLVNVPFRGASQGYHRLINGI
jgi:hypothetical protein